MSESTMKTVPRIHIVGKRNSGKTTLVCELVKHLTATGLKIATVKHTHHTHELDTPGKDSHQHRLAGAAAVGILSNDLTAVFVPEQRSSNEDQRYARLQQMFADCDLILVEGDLHTSAPKIEVWRQSNTDQPYADEHADIQAIITDDDWPDKQLVRRSDLPAVAALIHRLIS